MKIKLLLVLSCFAFVFSLTACKSLPQVADKTSGKTTTTTTETTTLPPFVQNPLTGVRDLPSAAAGKRPIAIMINNIKTAWSVQTGLGNADIVYETLAEGGITRYMAVFSNITKNDSRIGTVRSSRYTYAELALGHDALYVHCGSDDLYTTPFMRNHNMDDLDLGANASRSGVRVKNGKAYEHTLYTSGALINKSIVKLDRRTDLKSSKNKPYFNFNPEGNPVKPALEAASIKVKFSDSYSSSFKYSSEKGLYLKSQGGMAQNDYKTGKQVKSKNVIVIFTPIVTRPDNYHVKSDLSSGMGYYFSEGGYQAIKWSKDGAENSLHFTNEDGTALSINTGNTWICITQLSLKSSCIIS